MATCRGAGPVSRSERNAFRSTGDVSRFRTMSVATLAVLGELLSGPTNVVPAPGNALEGTTSVRLVASVNGAARVDLVDTSGSITTAGSAGITARQRNATIQRFRVYGK